MAYAERGELAPRIAELEQKLRIALLPKDAADEKSAILEVRAGTGGDEAALFAADLFRMYTRYADLNGWKAEIISISESDLGGYKEIVASITGQGVFAKLKFESGVHRVQRIPATEAGGRIHTSAATVAVLPEAEDVDVDIRSEDVRIDTMRAGGAGGQHVNKTESAVRMTHLPTGIMVVSAEKSQHQNRRLAMAVLKARVFELQREKLASERSDARKTAGWVGRSFAADPHLQFSARARHRPPHQHDALQPRRGDGGSCPRPIDRRADRRSSGDAACRFERGVTSAEASLRIDAADDVRTALAALTQAFRSAELTSPEIDARFLLQGVTGLTGAEVIAAPTRKIGSVAQRLNAVARRRLAHEPVSRILGEREFYGRRFAVTPDVLDPRPETETVVETTLRIVDDKGWREKPITIVDVGVGSGAIAVTLLAELKRARAFATDVSAAALAVAGDNAARHGVSDRFFPRMTSGLNGLGGPLDIIVSNPPYIATAEMAGLPPEVRRYDPVLALDGGSDGLAIYRKIASDIMLLGQSPSVVLEVGSGQHDAVKDIFLAAGGRIYAPCAISAAWSALWPWRYISNA